MIISYEGGVMNTIVKRFAVLLVIAALIAGCGSKPGLNVQYEKYTLANGLEVVLHEDRSDPIAAVAVQYHVGSNREEKGRTGFAHLFEHMMFQESQHVGQDQFFKKIQEVGGTLNGGTWVDGTVYFEIVPKNALEMALWMEADRLGYLLSRVTKEAFINQQNVVQNEKRQVVDNRPYGHTNYVIDKLLYPAEHPYNWQVIGEMEDLTNATLADVHAFHQKWYRPNNATLVVAGDFDVAETKDWIEKYFGEIPSGEAISDFDPMPVTLAETQKAFHEDNFAKSPELNMVIPTVEQFTDDAYALDMLGDLLADGKKAPLYKILVEEKKLAPSIRGYNNSQELAGVFQIRVRTFPGINLTDVEKAIAEAFARFEEDKFTVEDLDRIKASTETGFYNGISSILGKSFQLAQYNEYAGSPGYISQDLARILAVTPDDVWRVYNKYIKDKPYVLTSFIPKGQADLVAEGSERYPIVEESVTQQAEVTDAKGEDIQIEDLPSSFDRSVEPPKGPDPLLTIPKVWKSEMANGIQLYGIQQSELPLIQFSVRVKGGMLLDEPGKIGTANLISDMIMEGTKNKTPIELEEAIDNLGAYIRAYTNKEYIVIQANCLSSKIDDIFALVQEILFEPRWDEVEFARIQQETIETIKRRKVNPAQVASEIFDKLVYGDENKLSNSSLGDAASVAALTIDDLKNYYNKNFSPTVTKVSVVGDLSQGKAVSLFKSMEVWKKKEVRFPELPPLPEAKKPKLYFVDFPNAKQSQIRVGHGGLAYTDPEYHAATVMNYKLGGSFSGFLNLILREEKGFTYGARSQFRGTNHPGTFMASSGVRSTATLESAQIFKDEILGYREGITEEDLTFTKDALIKSNARRFETLGALMGMLNNIAMYDLPVDYIKNEENTIRNMSQDQLRALAQKHIHPDQMIFLVAGDAKTQMRQLSKLGLGRPVLLDTNGEPVK